MSQFDIALFYHCIMHCRVNALNSEAVYCWDHPIDADAGCIYLERDIQSRLNRYAVDADITDVWVWYEPVSAGSYLIYIGYA